MPSIIVDVAFRSFIALSGLLHRRVDWIGFSSNSLTLPLCTSAACSYSSRFIEIQLHFKLQRVNIEINNITDCKSSIIRKALYPPYVSFIHFLHCSLSPSLSMQSRHNTVKTCNLRRVNRTQGQWVSGCSCQRKWYLLHISYKSHLSVEWMLRFNYRVE